MRHSARARAQVALACAALLAAPPAAALAAANPVHVDPKSPVAKEYALPLATARGAAPESGQTGSLFGSGITADRSTSPASSEPATTPVAPATTTTKATHTQTSPPPAKAPAKPAAKPPAKPPAKPGTKSAAKPPAKPPAKPGATVEATPAAYRVLRAGSGSGLLWMVVAAVLVIALGSAGGFLLSRRR